jgi:hypothetical protein
VVEAPALDEARCVAAGTQSGAAGDCGARGGTGAMTDDADYDDRMDDNATGTIYAEHTAIRLASARFAREGLKLLG